MSLTKSTLSHLPGFPLIGDRSGVSAPGELSELNCPGLAFGQLKSIDLRDEYGVNNRKNKGILKNLHSRQQLSSHGYCVTVQLGLESQKINVNFFFVFLLQ